MLKLETERSTSTKAKDQWKRLLDKIGILPNPIFKLSKGLKPKLEKKWLVLDLDETLIHSTSKGSKNCDHMVEVLMDKHAALYYVYKRPHVEYFLNKVGEWYKLAIFTASMSEYANAVIDLLDPDHSLIKVRLYRESCIAHEDKGYIKDLSLIESDLSQVLLIDNSPRAFEKHPNNSVVIQSWYNQDAHDQALLDLLPFLDALRFTNDVRSILSFRTN